MPVGMQLTGQRQFLEAASSHSLTQQSSVSFPYCRKRPFTNRSSCKSAPAPCACAAVASASYEDKEVSNLNVNQAVINPSFRSTPWEAEKREDSSRTVARICFVSESNVCRAPLALGAFTQLLEEHNLQDLIECSCRGTRDYNVGEGIEPAAVDAALELGIPLPEAFAAQTFDYEQDIVHYDMVLVVDKFVAADVMREISVYDTINKLGKYTQKVRRLGEFHPELGNALEYDGQDIDDPLYGNVGGDTERRAVLRTAALVRESCEGLVAFLQDLQSTGSGDSLCQQLNNAMKGMKELEWLVPPMLQKR